ncbi:alpha/beta fold hydrolase [Yersinia kristensenii]|uniref:alpha/beta fold hydrolase n=1 Tax=Yersinia kristensenii TaxID=28152 RepID=UPI001D11E1BD
MSPLWLRKSFTEPVHVIGHSVGGAVAVLFARRYPEMTRSLTSVEGNFTLSDAFWSDPDSKSDGLISSVLSYLPP